MKRNVVSGIAELSSRLKALDAEVDLISFDIFDTLLERHVEPPDTVKALAAHLTSTLFTSATQRILPDESVVAVRHEIETTLRTQARVMGFDYECAFSDVARKIAQRLAPDEEAGLQSALIKGELEAESRALYLKGHVVELLASLRARGKRIVATSDMYLDGVLIDHLFKHFGLSGLVDRVYVSSDLKLGKYSGRLFRHVLEVEGVLPTRMVHVGDNRHSDFDAPVALGIRAFHLHDVVSLRRRQVVRTLNWLGLKNPYWRGEHLLGIISPLEGSDFHYRYGYNHLGPIFSGFALGILEELRLRQINKVFFLAREGDLFRAVYSKLGPPLAANFPQACYLYLSRKSVFLPASWRGLPRRYLNVVLYNPKQQGLLSVANALGIPSDEFVNVARRFDLNEVCQPITGWSEKHYRRLMADREFQEIIIRHAQPARLLLRQYLEKEGFFGKQSVALVDIGWNGTIQHALRETFGDDDDFPETIGLYLSFNDGFQYQFGSDEVKGILYDGRTSPARHNVFALFEELFENAARALHGTTVGYRKATEGVEPVLRSDETADRRAERQFEAHTVALRQGVLDFADSFVNAVRLTGYCFEDIKPALLAKAERCVVFPSREETERFLEIVHAEDLGSDKVMTFDEYRLPGLTILLRPKRFLRLLRTSNWKYGTARTLRLPGFNHLLRRIELALAWFKGKAPSSVLCHRSLLSERFLLVLVKRGFFPVLNRVRKLSPKKWR